MSKTYTLPPPLVDEVPTAEMAYDVVDETEAVLYANVFIRDALIANDPDAPEIAIAGDDIEASVINDIRTALDILDTKVADAEIGAALHDATPADDDKIGYWSAAGVWEYATWLELKTLIVSSVASVATEIHAATAQSPLVDGDEFGIAAFGASYGIKKVLWSVVKSTMKTYMDGVYQALDTQLTSLAGLVSVTNLVSIANLTLAANRSIYTNSAGAIAANGVWVTVKKLVDQTKTATVTVATDTELQFAMLAGKKYAIRGKIFYNTPAGADFRFKFVSPASPAVFRGSAGYIIPGSTTFVKTVYALVPSTNTDIDGASTTGGQIEFDIMVQNTNAGTFGFSWAQRVSNAGATKVFGGSYIEYMIMD